MRNFGVEVGYRIRGGFDAQRGEVGVCRRFFDRCAGANDIDRLSGRVLREIFRLERIHVANMTSVVILVHHGGRDGDKRRGARRSVRRGPCRDGGEVAINLDGRSFLQRTTIHGLFRQGEIEDDVIVLLSRCQIGDRRRNPRFACGRLTGCGAAREKEKAGEHGKKKMENGWRRGGNSMHLRGWDPFSIFHFLFSRECSG